MRFSHLEVTHSKNGALLIGKAPHIAEYAWLNVMYPCITEAEVCDLGRNWDALFPEIYRDFLMNGDRYDATPLKSWDSLSAMLTSEIERIFSLFDADGRIFSRMAPTTPVAL